MFDKHSETEFHTIGARSQHMFHNVCKLGRTISLVHEHIKQFIVILNSKYHRRSLWRANVVPETSRVLHLTDKDLQRKEGNRSFKN